MFQFVTHAHVVLLAMHLWELNSPEQTPEDFPIRAHTRQKEEWVRGQAERIVDFCNQAVSMDDIRQVLSTDAEAAIPHEGDDDDDDDDDDDGEVDGCPCGHSK